MKRLPSLAVVLSAALLAAGAGAQTAPDKAAKKAARTLAEAAQKSFDGGDYPGAITKLREAEKHVPAPTILRLRARAHEKLGQLVEAADAYRRAVDQKLPADAPAVFVTAQEESKKALASLEPRIPKVRIALSHPPEGTLVTLDGKPLAAASLGSPLPLDPGKHVVTIEPPGATTIRREIDLRESANEAVEVDLSPPPAPSLAPSVSATPAMSVTPAPPPKAPGPTATARAAPLVGSGPAAGEEPSSRSFLGPAVAFGVGGAGLLVGAITGGLSLGVVGDIRSRCSDDLVCSRSVKSRVEEGKTFAYVSTVAFALAGTGAAVGVVLLLLPGREKGEPTRTAITVGPGFLSLKGAF